MIVLNIRYTSTNYVRVPTPCGDTEFSHTEIGMTQLNVLVARDTPEAREDARTLVARKHPGDTALVIHEIVPICEVTAILHPPQYRL